MNCTSHKCRRSTFHHRIIRKGKNPLIFVGYFTALSVTQSTWRQILGLFTNYIWKAFGRKRSWPTQDTIPQFTSWHLDTWCPGRNSNRPYAQQQSSISYNRARQVGAWRFKFTEPRGRVVLYIITTVTISTHQRTRSFESSNSLASFSLPSTIMPILTCLFSIYFICSHTFRPKNRS